MFGYWLFRRIQFCRLRITFIILIVWCGIVIVLYFSVYGFLSDSISKFNRTRRVKYVKRIGNYSSACRLPSLDPFHPSILKYVKDLGKLQCTGERFSTFKNNVLEVKGPGISAVQYRTIERPRGDDFGVVLSAPSNVWNLVMPTIQPKLRMTTTLVSILYSSVLLRFLRWRCDKLWVEAKVKSLRIGDKIRTELSVWRRFSGKSIERKRDKRTFVFIRFSNPDGLRFTIFNWCINQRWRCTLVEKPT